MYIIGDTIQLRITIKNLAGEEEAPASISVKVYTPTKTMIYEDTTPTLIGGTTAQYYSDWLIDTVAETTQLKVLWEWTGHRKSMVLNVEPAL